MHVLEDFALLSVQRVGDRLGQTANGNVSDACLRRGAGEDAAVDLERARLLLLGLPQARELASIRFL